jgi:hypothetical protein
MTLVTRLTIACTGDQQAAVKTALARCAPNHDPTDHASHEELSPMDVPVRFIDTERVGPDTHVIGRSSARAWARSPTT